MFVCRGSLEFEESAFLLKQVSVNRSAHGVASLKICESSISKPQGYNEDSGGCIKLLRRAASPRYDLIKMLYSREDNYLKLVVPAGMSPIKGFAIAVAMLDCKKHFT